VVFRKAGALSALSAVWVEVCALSALWVEVCALSALSAIWVEVCALSALSALWVEWGGECLGGGHDEGGSRCRLWAV
jgi:hypothetical protein